MSCPNFLSQVSKQYLYFKIHPYHTIQYVIKGLISNVQFIELHTTIYLQKSFKYCYYFVFLHSMFDICRANSFKRSISHVEFNKSHVVLRNDVQFSKSTSHLLKLQVLFEIDLSFVENCTSFLKTTCDLLNSTCRFQQTACHFLAIIIT